MKKQTIFRAVAVSLVLAIGLPVVAYLVWRRAGMSREVQDIFVQNNEVGYLLRPGMRRVMQSASTTPLFPLDNDQELSSKMERAFVSFHLSTNARGFRGGEVTARPAAGTTRIICVGDSISFGWGVPIQKSFCKLLEKRLASHGQYEAISTGIPGHTSRSAERVLKKRILQLNPHVVTICIGVNDINELRFTPPKRHPPGKLDALLTEYEANLRSMLTRVRQAGAKAVLLIPPTSTFYPSPIIDRISRAKISAGREHDVPVLDLRRLIARNERKNGVVLEGQKIVRYEDGAPRVLHRSTAGGPSSIVPLDIYRYLLVNSVRQRLLLDGCHPTEEGHALIATELARTVLRITKR